MPCGFVYYIHWRSTRERIPASDYIHLREVSARLLVLLRWAFQSLRTWNEKTVRHPRFYILSQTEFQNAVCQRVP